MGGAGSEMRDAEWWLRFAQLRFVIPYKDKDH